MNERKQAKRKEAVPTEIYRQTAMNLPGYRDSVRAAEPAYGGLSDERRQEFLNLLREVSELDMAKVKLRYFEEAAAKERERIAKQTAQLGVMSVQGIDPRVLGLLSPQYQEVIARTAAERQGEAEADHEA